MVIELETRIVASPEVCFDLSLSIDLHLQSTKQTEERVIAGRTMGVMALGDTVTWEAKHFGVWQLLTSKITAHERPFYFVDSMVDGPFKSIYHEHIFEPEGHATIMRDRFKYEVPFGLTGKLFDFLFLRRHLVKLLVKRNELLRTVAQRAVGFLRTS